MQSLVSVVIPTHNDAEYVKDAITSALNQSYSNVEIVVVDDGSSDNTREVLKPYILNGSIKYIFQKNKGLSGARNTAIRASKGDFIALLDADDLFLPQKIERQVEHFKKNKQCDISYCDIYHFYDKKPLDVMELQYDYYSNGDVLPNLIKGNFIAPLAVVAKRSVFERFGFFDERMKRSEDLEFWIRVVLGGGVIKFLPETLAKLRIRTQNNLQDFASQPLVKKTKLDILDRLNDNLSVSQKRQYRLNFYRSRQAANVAAAYFLAQQDRKKAYKFLNQAVLIYPLNLTWLILLYMFFLLFPSAWAPSALKFYYKVKNSIVFKKAKYASNKSFSSKV